MVERVGSSAAPLSRPSAPRQLEAAPPSERFVPADPRPETLQGDRATLWMATRENPAPSAEPALQATTKATPEPSSQPAHGSETSAAQAERAEEAFEGKELELDLGDFLAQDIALAGTSGFLVSHAGAGASVLPGLAEGSSLLASGLITSGVVGSAAVGLGSAALGACQVREGLQDGSMRLVAEGTASVLAGVGSGAFAVNLAGQGATGALAAAGEGAGALLAPLGAIDGVFNAGLGVHDVVVGTHEKDPHKIAGGAMAVGFGLSLLASSVGGGTPALMASGVFLAGRLINRVLTPKQG